MAGNALGASKTAAKLAGISLAEYQQRIAAGLKRCTDCKSWIPRSGFVSDASRSDGLAASCSACRTNRHKERYKPVPADQRKRMGPSPLPAREGDKRQARHRVNVLVQDGRLPDPNSLPCSDCGHVGTNKRHEYDHHLGYAAEHHLDVQAVCAKCHRQRERNRGVQIGSKKREKTGRFAPCPK